MRVNEREREKGKKQQRSLLRIKMNRMGLGNLFLCVFRKNQCLRRTTFTFCSKFWWDGETFGRMWSVKPRMNTNLLNRRSFLPIVCKDIEN